ncbi:LysE family transporter [Alicyclobacillus sp.]|uniref:LysE family translocator n=1 Tax=Alicyclobacillus sp. TaxID=61169 RepID=UPI0025C60E1A|nr:LysE family transporter [Alicyclobacillus sp.]MCL6516092.1 LysE family transporter [Alicyclobacillus sp.]
MADLMLALFVSGFLLSLSLCLDIGIVNVAVIKTGLEKGALPSFLVGLGSAFGDLVYATVSMLGLSALLRSTVVRWALWLGGTVVLLYLSVHMLKETLRPQALAGIAGGRAGAWEAGEGADDRLNRRTGPGGDGESPAHGVRREAVPGGSRWKPLWMGFGLALSSPSAILWFAAVGGSVIASTGQHVHVRGLAAFFAGFFCAGALWSAAVAYVAGRARHWLGPLAMRAISLVSALLMVYFAVQVFLRGWRTWVG